MDIAGSDLESEKFSTLIDDEMELESIEPSHRVFSSLREFLENLMGLDSAVRTDDDRCGVDIGDSGHSSLSRLQVGAERYHRLSHEFDKAIIANEMRKSFFEIIDYEFGIIRLEMAIIRGVEENGDRHHLAQGKSRFSLAFSFLRKSSTSSLDLENLAEIINLTKETSFGDHFILLCFL